MGAVKKTFSDLGKLAMAIVDVRAQAIKDGTAETNSKLFVDILLQAADPKDGVAGLTNTEVRDNAVAFLFAGSETTATSTCWTLYHLIQTPRVLKKLRAEVDR